MDIQYDSSFIGEQPSAPIHESIQENGKEKEIEI